VTTTPILHRAFAIRAPTTPEIPRARPPDPPMSNARAAGREPRRVWADRSIRITTSTTARPQWPAAPATTHRLRPHLRHRRQKVTSLHLRRITTSRRLLEATTRAGRDNRRLRAVTTQATPAARRRPAAITRAVREGRHLPQGVTTRVVPMGRHLLPETITPVGLGNRLLPVATIRADRVRLTRRHIRITRHRRRR
jgi:hypothetical protein